MVPLTAGDRSHVVPSTSGGVQQRWGLIAAAPRQAQAQRTVGKQRLKYSNEEVKGFKKLCRTPFACEAEAPQALSTVGHSVQATGLSPVPVRSTLGYGKRGRPSQGAQPARVVSTIDGALASSLATRQALIDQPRWFILATNAREEAMVSPPEVLHGDTGQAPAERGFRCLKEPPFLASSFSLTQPGAFPVF